MIRKIREIIDKLYVPGISTIDADEALDELAALGIMVKIVEEAFHICAGCDGSKYLRTRHVPLRQVLKEENETETFC